MAKVLPLAVTSSSQVLPPFPIVQNLQKYFRQLGAKHSKSELVVIPNFHFRFKPYYKIHSLDLARPLTGTHHWISAPPLNKGRIVNFFILSFHFPQIILIKAMFFFSSEKEANHSLSYSGVRPSVLKSILTDLFFQKKLVKMMPCHKKKSWDHKVLTKKDGW